MSVIGIDLGTTNSCVAVINDGMIEVLANDQGDRLTPSYVSFTGQQELVGKPAKDELKTNDQNTLYQIKRLIGRKYNDAEVQEDIKMLPFTVVNNNNNAKIKVVYMGQTKVLSPEEISAKILEKMKNTAEMRLGEITKAVITVPAYFNDAQRRATRDAGKIAGLNVIGMINEPTAAAISYGLIKKIRKKLNVLVFDLGGGTFDVTIVTIEDGVFNVRATGGDSHLGGEDFTTNIVRYFVEEFENKCGERIAGNKKAMSSLRSACEEAKRSLSAKFEVSVVVDSLQNHVDFRSSLTRAKFNNLNFELFKKTVGIVENTLSDSGLRKNEINEVVLVGGSTRIPKIREMLQDLFGNTSLKRTVNPDEAIACGAAVYAQWLSDPTKSELVKDFVLNDVTPLSIGIEGSGRDMDVVIPRNTKLPVIVWKTRVTKVDNQPTMKLRIFEGERALTADNHLLGSFEIRNIPPAPRGKGKVKTCIEVNRNGILRVTGVEDITGATGKLTIRNTEGRLSQEEIDRMIEDARKRRTIDGSFRMRSKAMNKLENFSYEIKSKIEEGNVGDQVSQHQLDYMLNKLDKTLEWLRKNRKEVVLLSEIQKREDQLKLVCNPIIDEGSSSTRL